jgi:Thaumatin family
MFIRSGWRSVVFLLVLGLIPKTGSGIDAPAAVASVPVRTLAVTNSGSDPVWIGATGGAVVPGCQMPNNGGFCLSSPALTSSSGCACNATQQQNGTLICPPNSTPTFSSTGNGCSCSTGNANACGGSGATTTCASTPGGEVCMWTLPSPATHGTSTNPWELLQGETATFKLPAPNWGTASQPLISPVWWNGGVFGRTGCQSDGTSCTTASCPSAANQNCPAGQGPLNPFSQAEFTLQTSAPDFYDVTLINGVNTVVIMAPQATPEKASVPPNSDASYWCTAPGSKQGSSGLGACSWSFSPTVPGLGDQTALLQFSSLPCSTANTPTGCPTGLQCSGAPGACNLQCTANSDCPGTFTCVNNFCQCATSQDCASVGLPASQQFCGLQFIPGRGTFQQQCGAFGGWWSAFDFCNGSVASVGPLNCSASITDGDGSSTTTLNNLFQCTGENAASCYNTTQGSKICCGCATDSANTLAKDWPKAATGNTCFGNNTTWASKVQPWLVFLKQGCPTAYSYPFDDATSTFQCQTTGSTNMASYTITLSTLAAPSASPAPR